MSINRVLTTALKDERIIWSVYPWELPELPQYPCISYTFISDVGALYSEDEEDIEHSEIQINIFSKGSTTAIAETVKQVLKENGFTKGRAFSRFDKQTSVYIYTIRFLKENQ